MTRYVALLRGINVGSTRKVPMAELRDLCADAGFKDVATYIQSGNLMLSTDLEASEVAARLEQRIKERFGLDVPVIVRTASQWSGYASGSAFPDAEAARPKLLHLCLAASSPDPSAQEVLSARASADERVVLDGDALWIDFGAGVARSKLTPLALDRAAGSPVTARNWNSVLAINTLLMAG